MSKTSIKTVVPTKNTGSAALKNKIGQAAEFLWKYRTFAAFGLQCAFLIALNSFPAAAQNPFGSSGTTKLSNFGSNTLVVLTWLAGFIGIASVVLIGICIFFEMGYKKFIASALFGFGGFAVLGSVAYDLVNLGSISMSDPTLGN